MMHRSVRLVRVLVHAPGEIGAETEENPQRCHLAGKTCYHDVDPGLTQVWLIVVRSRGNGSSGSLQHKREEVAKNEDDGVCSWLETGDILAVDNDDMTEADVDGGTEEGRTNGEAD